MLNSVESELFKNQYIFARIDSILKDKGYLKEIILQ